MSEHAPRPIFIHGAGGGIDAWDAQLDHFEGAGVVALPGHPEGDPCDTIEAYAACVAAAIAGDDRPIVCVGHSMGGQIALQMALDDPELVRGVIVLASGAHIEVPAHSRAAMRDDFASQCERFARAAYVTPDEDVIHDDVLAMMSAGQETILADYDALDAWRGGKRLSEIGQPVLVVAAHEDRITPPTLSATLAAKLANSMTAEIPAAGHMVQREGARSVNLLIAGFLARLEIALQGG